MESKSKSTVCLLPAPFSLVNYKMLGIPHFCSLFVCGKRPHSGRDFFVSSLPSPALWQSWFNYSYSMENQQHLRCNVNTCIIHMVNEVKQTRCVTYFRCIWNPIIENEKITTLRQIHLKSTLHSFVTQKSKNYDWKFCFITIGILFWSSIIVLTLEQYRLFISVLPWRQPSLNY